MLNSARNRVIAERIKKTFLSNSPNVKVYPAHHFAVRVYRITGDSLMKGAVLGYLLQEGAGVLRDIENGQDRDYVKKRASELYRNMKEGEGRKEIMRQKFFYRRRECLFYYNLIQHLYFWRCFGISRGRFRAQYEKGLSILRDRKSRIIQYILDEGAVRCYGSQIINHVYFLRFFGICDVRNRFLDVWKGIFMGTDRLPEYVYRNKIYGMTHFIIAGSDYYQRLASKREFGYILDYFQGNVEGIIRRTHIDIIAEVGLCLRLCGIRSGRALKMTTDYVAGAFDRNIGFIPRKGFVPKSKERDINVAEHTNAISFMLLRGFRRLYPGPDIGKEFDAKASV